MSASRYLIVDANDMIVNVILWDGNVATWQPPSDCVAVFIPEGTPGGPGDRWDFDLQQIVAGETLP